MSTISSASAPLSFPRRRSRPVAGALLRARVLAHRERLDRMLIEGADPVTTDELTLRAYQLSRPSHRRALAASIDDAVRSAATRRRRSPAAPPLARKGIDPARPALAELSRALREEPVVAARGVALARRLLTDGAGPLYVENGDAALRIVVDETVRALAPGA
jgi:hypothetical protein